MVKILFIEGNIGSGKSTSISYLQQRFTHLKKHQIFIYEPVEHWQNLPTLNGNSINLLDAFYKDISKYSFCFQSYAFLSRMKLLLDAVKLAEYQGFEWIICERSIFTDREIFLESLHENGSITTEEKAVYHELWNFWISILQPFFKKVEIHFLYLSCVPNITNQHIIERNRSEEKDVPFDYLVQLHQKHNNLYLGNNNNLTKLLKVLTGNANLQVKFHIIHNNHGKTKLYEELDYFTNDVLLHSNSIFGLVDLKKIWNYWDFFWDVD